MAARKKEKPPGKPGPSPDTLALEGNWEEAIAKALKKVPETRPPKKESK